MELHIISTFTFRASGYTDDDRIELTKTFNDFGSTRLRPEAMPDAGGSGEIWIVLQFIGLAIGSGALTEMGVDLYHRLCAALNQFIQRKNNHGSIPVEIAKITLSFDDMDIIIHNPSDKILDSLDLIIQRARQGINNGALRGLKPTRIAIPAVPRNGIWHTKQGPIEMRNDDPRYWSITTADSYISHGYDSQDDLLLETLLKQTPGDSIKE